MLQASSLIDWEVVQSIYWMYLSILIIVSPQWTDFILSTDVPNGEWNIFVFDCFNVEAWTYYYVTISIT